MPDGTLELNWGKSAQPKCAVEAWVFSTTSRIADRLLGRRRNREREAAKQCVASRQS